MRFLAQEFHDIAAPVDYSLVPPWVIFLLSAIVLTTIGWIIWYARKYVRKALPTRTSRERALEALDRLESDMAATPPYQFSIQVSDVLRRFVVEEFGLHMTRQTSVEFLNAIGAAPQFKEHEKGLLADFLSRCDLIKFARYDATCEDSRLLLDEARQFVKGESLVTA